mgnify:CR=1 FL=1
MKINILKTITIVKRELHGYFTSPLAYVFIIIFLMLCGFFTFKIGNLFAKNEATLSNTFFNFLPWLFLLLVPSIAMRLWSEEYKSGTIELLFTMPVSIAEAVIGKFLAAWVVLIVSLLLTFPTVYTVGKLGSPDYGVMMTGYIGAILLCGAYLALGSFTSSLTRNQVISFIISLVLCLLLLIISLPVVTDFFITMAPVWLLDLMGIAGVFEHYDNLKRGVVDFRDIFYFVSVIFVALSATGISLSSKRTAI